MQSVFHLALHFLVPLVFARLGYREWWLKAWLIMLSAMVIDVDHLIADPIYDPDRCSINFHPLHSYPAILLYVLLVFIPAMRVFGLGLLIHIVLDGIDCVWP